MEATELCLQAITILRLVLLVVEEAFIIHLIDMEDWEIYLLAHISAVAEVIMRAAVAAMVQAAADTAAVGVLVMLHTLLMY
jgi:hypothetical protein